MDIANLRIITDLKNFLTQLSSDIDLRSHCIVSKQAFSRTRCLPLSTLVLMILNLPKRSLSIELQSFFDYIHKKSCSKSAFCQQRTKLKSLFFVLWNRVLIKGFYHYYGERVKHFKGFRLLAFDGSSISLPNTPNLCALYGQSSNKRGKCGATSHCSIMYDVLNKLILDCKLSPCFTGERSLVPEHLKHAPDNCLLTFDRGYPSYWLFYFLSRKKYKFVMRGSCRSKVVKDFLHSSEQDCIKSFYPDNDAIRQMSNMGIKVGKSTPVCLRLVKVPLKTGETEVLITNLYSSEQFSIQDLKEIYALRWQIETCFGTLKNQLQIENFSGVRQICVEQDFFANIFVYNLQSLIEKQCNTVVCQENKIRKHKYRINKNISWAILKNRIIDLFLEDTQTQILMELQALFEKYLEPVRDNRTYSRKRKIIHGRGKYITLNNYKRAL